MQRRSTVVGIVVLLLLFGSGAVLTLRLASGGRVPGLVPSRVAILPLVGVLDSESRFLEQLERFRSDPSVRAFVLEIRSPGGTVGASQEIHGALRRLREEDGRPLIAWIGGVGASGGYYAALPADSILALPGAITGSIGVVMQFPDAGELLDWMGIDLQVVKSGELKDLGSPARPLAPEERAVLQRLADDVRSQFVEAVVEGRGLEPAEVERLADGRVVSGQRAVDLGLIDRLGTLQDAVDVAGEMAGIGTRPRTVRPAEERVSLLDLLQGVEESRLLSWGRALARGATGLPELRFEWIR
ncbi:MAG: signal peptide peptidase SppA [Gemmatimonadota bacterium]|nr:signal peptide peptidase SppA [Gemmatimonadota bacterium]